MQLRSNRLVLVLLVCIKFLEQLLHHCDYLETFQSVLEVNVLYVFTVTVS